MQKNIGLRSFRVNGPASDGDYFQKRIKTSLKGKYAERFTGFRIPRQALCSLITGMPVVRKMTRHCYLGDLVPVKHVFHRLMFFVLFGGVVKKEFSSDIGEVTDDFFVRTRLT